jgi:hypothetical protein
MVGSPNARMVITATIAAEIARICVISCFSLNTEDASIRPSKQARYTGKPPSIGVCFRRLSAKRQCDSGRIEGLVVAGSPGADDPPSGIARSAAQVGATVAAKYSPSTLWSLCPATLRSFRSNDARAASRRGRCGLARATMSQEIGLWARRQAGYSALQKSGGVVPRCGWQSLRKDQRLVSTSSQSDHCGIATRTQTISVRPSGHGGWIHGRCGNFFAASDIWQCGAGPPSLPGP